MKYLFQTVSLFILIIQTNSNLIVIPFINKEISGEDNHQYIYTQIEIGDPPQKIDSLLNFQESYFHISNITNSNINLNSSYNSSLSSSFKILSTTNISNFNNIISEKIYFYTEINCENENKKKYNISPILYPEININESLFNIIGLQTSNNIDKSFNIINIIKKLNIIDNYFWTINIDSNLTEGKIIIGDLPHNYEKKLADKNLTFINTYSKENKIFWGLQFSAIKFEQRTITDLMIGKIEPNILEIFGSYEYINAIEEIYFEKYKKGNVCRKKFDKINGEDIFRFVCDKNMFNKSDIDLFPNLTLISVELNYSFVFTGEELFMEKNDDIYFMIVSKVGKTDGEWDLGRIFLYKYQFVMDNDNNLIGIYKEKDNNNEPKDKNYTMLIIILSILLINLIIALVVVIYYIRKNICKTRKRRLSEISDEDYIYFTHIKE